MISPHLDPPSIETLEDGTYMLCIGGRGYLFPDADSCLDAYNEFEDFSREPTGLFDILEVHR